MCIDYRLLNKLTVKNKYPMPRTEDLFDRVTHAKIFTKIDLEAAYHQVRIHEPDIPKSAFITPFGHYEFTVVTFGFTNAPATFQHLMNSVLLPYLDKFVVVYIDDILIYSETVEEHAEHLRQVLAKLREHKLYIKRSKCEFGVHDVEYLGHHVLHGELTMDPAKQKAIADWPQPTNAHDLHVFLGLTNYYRRFIRCYSHIAAPLTSLCLTRYLSNGLPNAKQHFRS